MQGNGNNRLFTKQLSKGEFMPDERYREIAGLIYDTDQYIFPALFEGADAPRTAAEDVISHVLKEGTDRMYCAENLFVCYENSTIVGMILWCRGALDWNYEEFIQSAAQIGVCLQENNVIAVNNAFFGKQNPELLVDTITLINVCVHSSKRGKRIGSFMLKEFTTLYKNSKMELSVLKNNPPAINLYKRNGFRITGEYPGFSQTDIKPICYGMERALLPATDEDSTAHIGKYGGDQL